MKTIKFLAIILLLFSSSIFAIDYDNDGSNDDPYMPTFLRWKHDQLSVFLDLDSTQTFYALTLDNDSSTEYIFHSQDGFELVNNHDNIMQPLEMAELRIRVYPDRLPSMLTQDIEGGALKLEVRETPNNTIINSVPVTIYDNTELSLVYTVAYVTPEMELLPLSLNLYNTSSNENIYINSANQGKFMHTDDRPFGQVTSIDHTFIYNDVTILSGEDLSVHGWAFDDDSNMDIYLSYKKFELDNDNLIDSDLTKYPDTINSEIPYWGDNYNSGFTISSDDPSPHGHIDLSVHLKDADHDIKIATEQIFWNQKPEGDIFLPLPDAQIITNQMEITGRARDMDVDVNIAAYLSTVEVYLDNDNNPLIKVTHTELENDTLEFNFVLDNVFDYSEGTHILYAVATDSYGLSKIFGTRTIEIAKYDPVIVEISPRLGPWKGNSILSITGDHFLSVTDVMIGNYTAEIIHGSQTDSLIQVRIPMIDTPQSQYVDVSITNTYSSTVRRDGYRFIPAELNNLSLTGVISDMKYNNFNSRLYLLDKTASSISYYSIDEANDLSLEFDGNFDTHTIGLPVKMDFSKSGTKLFVIYELNNLVDIYNIAGSGGYIDTISLLDNDGFPINTGSLSYMMFDSLLVGTTGLNSNLFLLTLDYDTLNHNISQLSLPYTYNSVEVYPCSNKSTAYILCKDSNSNMFDVYRFDAKNQTITQIPAVFTLLEGELDELKICVNYNGATFAVYTKSYIAKYDSKGNMLSYSHSGMDTAIYDALRDILYYVNDGDTHFSLKSSKDLNEDVTFCNFPEFSTATNIMDIDWTGEKMFALTAEGVAGFKVSHIYPNISVSPTFIKKSDTILLTANNAGHIPENVEIIVNNETQPSNLIDSDNDTHFFSIPVPMDNDTSGKISAKLYGYPSESHDLFMMTKLIDKVAHKTGLEFFYPSGLFYHENYSDLYAFDPSQTGGFSIVRLHIEQDNEGMVYVTRKPIPRAFQVSNPVSVSHVHNYVMVLSGNSKTCKWFDVQQWDDTGVENVHSAVFMPHLYPSGIVGYSPENNSSINYAYAWNKTSTDVSDIFQLNLDTGTIEQCDIVSPHTTDIYIDYDDNYLNDKAYAVSSTLQDYTSDYLTAFKPYETPSQIQPLINIFMPDSSGTYKVIANDDYLFASLIKLYGISVFYPDFSGVDNHYVDIIFESDSKMPRFLSANNEYLAFSASEPNNLFSFNLIDVNFWNNFPFENEFSLTSYYNISNNVVNDLKIIDNKIFVIINRDIYIIDLLEKKKN